MKMGSARLAASASRALEVDNREAPKDLTVACRCRGDELIVNVEHEEPLKVLSTLEDLLTCLAPLMKIRDLAEA